MVQGLKLATRHKTVQMLGAFLLIAWNANTFCKSAFAADVTAIPVPKVVIYAGQLISESLLRERKVPKTYLSRVIVAQEKSVIVGKVSRATLMPGKPVPLSVLSEPDAVRASRIALLIYEVGGLRISGEVMPLNSAKAGEIVRARNIRTGVVVTGTAMENGSIVVGFNK